MNHTQSVESNESLNGGLKGSRNKPNGIVLFDDEGVMWYREQYETELSKSTKTTVIYHNGLTPTLHRASYLA